METSAATGQAENGFEDVQDDVAPTRQRVFIARQACERCRQRKSRCDGGDPCSLCKTSGVDCKYSGRKATKNEVSLGMIFNALQRIEVKIDEQSHADSRDLPPTFQVPRKRARAVSTSFALGHNPMTDASALRDEYLRNTAGDIAQVTAASPTYTACSANSVIGSHRPPLAQHAPFIQYNIRYIATWPAIRALWTSLGDGPEFYYDITCATHLEQKRPLLPPPPSPMSNGGSLLSQVNVAIMKDLSESYFRTFNLTYPVLDRSVFKQHTLGVAIYSEFGYNVESCLVLAVMALGVLGKRALREAGFRVNPMTETDHIDNVGDGMAFFQEARLRAGVLLGDNTMQSCQFHLLCGVFYSQLLRPLEWASMVTRASACCTAFWECPPKDCDEWTLDMQSRLFWNTAMFEAVLTQDLDLPVSNLLDYEDRVPLPRFVKFSKSIASGLSPFYDSHGSGRSEDHIQEEALCEYHFLAQIAHRIILTRMRNSIFAPRKTQERGWENAPHVPVSELTPSSISASLPVESSMLGPAGSPVAPASLPTSTIPRRHEYPPKSLEDEMLHQLEQWRQQLPDILQWDDGNWMPQPTTPANILVVPWLRARYLIAKYHLLRPLFHRALHHPHTLTQGDIEKCQDVITCLMNWTEIMKLLLRCQSCLPLKFFICTQLFGLLMIFRGLEQSSAPELCGLLPPEYGEWYDWAFSVLRDFSAASPAVARELEILSALFNK